MRSFLFLFMFLISFQAIARTIDCLCAEGPRHNGMPTWKLTCASGYQESDIGSVGECWTHFGELNDQFKGAKNGSCACVQPMVNAQFPSTVELRRFTNDSPYIYLFGIYPTEHQMEACQAYLKALKDKAVCD